MKKSPLTLVKSQFNDKAGLIKSVQSLASKDLWFSRGENEKEDHERLQRVSNRKLLHLHEVLTDVKTKFGTRSALADEVLKLEKRTKDEGFRKRLEKWSTPRLWDAYRVAVKRDKASKAKSN